MKREQIVKAFRKLDGELSEAKVRHALSVFERRTKLWIELGASNDDAQAVGKDLGYAGPGLSQFVKTVRYAAQYDGLAKVALQAAAVKDDKGKAVTDASSAYLKGLTYYADNSTMPKLEHVLPKGKTPSTRDDEHKNLAGRLRSLIHDAHDSGFAIKGIDVVPVEKDKVDSYKALIVDVRPAQVAAIEPVANNVVTIPADRKAKLRGYLDAGVPYAEAVALLSD